MTPEVESTRHGLQFRCECLAGRLGLMPFAAEIAPDQSTYTVSLACRSCDRITKIIFQLDERVLFQRQERTRV